MAEARSSKLLLSTFIVLAVAVVSIAVVVVVVRMRDSEGSSSAALGSASSLEDLLSGPMGSSSLSASGLRAVILDKASLKDAIEVARPRMENTVGRLDVGSALLTLWASKKVTWDAIQALPETSPAQFRKDPDTERGKRLCMSGIVQDIRAEKTLAARLIEDRTVPLIERTSATSLPAQQGIGTGSGLATAALTATTTAPSASSSLLLEGLSVPDEDWSIPDDGKVFFATLEEKPEEAKPGESAVSHAAAVAKKELMSLAVVAVRSTRAIVDGTEARACGVLTGVTLPFRDNGVGATDAPEHRIIGMFDIPENRSAPGGETH